MNLPQAEPFKTCPKCGARWPLRADFLKDPEVTLAGFQLGPGGHTSGFFLFHHQKCGTSLAIYLPPFADLAKGPIVWRSKCSVGLPASFCLAPGTSTSCPLECVCEFVWDVTQAIQQWPKGAAPRA
ncbi:MAG: hypothetical protein HZA90_01125 [Verrucomicrobia bacterium]|nr:hypothetical protein [Verrucomicrobiota bacterium]